MREVRDGPISLMRLQFFKLRTAGCHGEATRTNRPSAGNVQRRVADDDNFLAVQFTTESPVATCPGDTGDFIAILMVVTIAAGDEWIPQAVVTQLDLRAEADVAREQAQQRRLGQRREFRKPVAHSGTRAAGEFMEVMVEPEHVAVEEPAEVLRRGLDTMRSEELAHQPRIGAARETHPLRAVAQPKLSFKCPRKRAHPRPAGMHQRAINVEENQSHHVAESSDGDIPRQSLRGQRNPDPVPRMRGEAHEHCRN